MPNEEMRARARKRKDLIRAATDLLISGPEWRTHEHCCCAECEDRIAEALLVAEERGKREAAERCAAYVGKHWGCDGIAREIRSEFSLSSGECAVRRVEGRL